MKLSQVLLTKLTASLAVCALAVIPLAARGANGTWINTAGGSWPNPANWSGGTIPGAADDTANFGTLSLGSAPVVTLDGPTTVGNLVFGDIGNTYGWRLSPGSGDPLTLAVSSGSPTITVNNQTNTINLVLDGTQGFTKAGSGTLVLSGANIFSGTATNSGGTLQLGDGVANNGVVAGNMSLASGTTLIFANPSDQTYTGVITSTGSGGTVTQRGSGALILGIGGQITGTNSVTIAPGATITLGGLDGATGNNRLPSAATAVWNISGNLNSINSAANTMPPSVILNGGTMTGTTNCYANFGTYFANGTTITANGTGNNISLPGGAFNVGIGANHLTFNTPLAADALLVAATINANNAAGRLTKSGLGTVTLTGTNTYTGATTISGGLLTIGGAGRLGNGVYAGLITNNGTLNYSSTLPQILSGTISGNGALTNNGPGTLTLYASNTYSGATILNGGTMVGVSAGGCRFSSVTVASSAATLSISVTNNTRFWNCTNLSFGAAGTLNFDFGAITPSGSLAPLIVSNAVAFTATPVVTVSGTAFGTLPIGQYPLMTWGSVSGTAPTTVTLPPHRGTATLIVSGNTLYLNITSLGTQPLYWTASSGAWDVGVTSNWKDSANNVTTFLNFDDAVFEDAASGAGPITVSLPANVAPSSVTFSNSTKAYTLAGTGAITGSSGLTKVGANSLVLLNTNTYTGTTVVRGGTLQLGDGVANNGVIAGGGIAVSNGAAIAFATPNNQSQAGVISGGGAATKSGAGTLTLSVSNSYSGGTAINDGTLRLLRPATINLSTTTVNSTGTLLLDGNNNTWSGAAGPTNRILLNGGTLGMSVASLQGFYVIHNGTVSNLPAASSTISMAIIGGAANNPPNNSDLFLDGGLTGSGTVTVTNGSDGIGLCLRNANTIFNGTLIVKGNPSTTGGTGSGLALGNNPAQPILTNANIQVDGTLELGNAASSMGWALGTVNGATLPIGALNGTGVVVANMPTAGFTRGLNVGGNNQNGTFSGEIANGLNCTLSLIKSGSGTQVLTGVNSFTGNTTVNGGLLQLNSPGFLQGPATVQSGGTLGGNGTIFGAVNVQSGGTLAVGNSSALATLGINNTLTFAANSTNVMRISKNGGTAANDQITGVTTLTYGGTLRLVNITSDGSPLALGDTFTLFPSATTYNPGGFGNVILPALPGGMGWDLSNLPLNGSITINNQASAPLFAPGSGGYVGAQAVTISSATVGATIRYTTDGSTPTSSSPIYSGPIAVPAPTNSMTIKAYASKAGFGDSAVSSATYATVVTPTWLNAFGGNWSDTASWSNTVVANGSGVTADFSTLTLPGDAFVTLNTPATVGTLKFADQGSAFTWNVTDGGAGPLTLNAGINQPVINVGNTETIISAGLDGTSGFIKTGAGALTLSGPNTYSGNTTVNAGVGGLKFTTAPSFTTFIGNGTVELNLGTTVSLAGTFGSSFTGQINITGAGTILSPVNNMSANLGDVSIDTGARMTINGPGVQADELTGPGLVNTAAAVNPAFATLLLGANNGNGGTAVFSGPMTSSTTLGIQSINIVKNGSGAQTLSGNLATGQGAVTVNGGTLTLGGNNTYTGATTVSNGTLLVNGSLNPTSAVYVASSGTLGGTGTISGTLTLDGSLSPGASVGSLTVGGAILRPGSVLRYEVASAIDGALRDLLTITNTLDLSQLTGSATIRLVSMANATTPGLVSDFNGGSTYSWAIANAVGVSGSGNLGNLVLDTSAFANTHPGTFSLAIQGNSLVLNYSSSLAPPTLSSYGPLTGNSFPLTFSGPNGQTYKVLGSTNVTLPLASWWQLSSGTFGASPVTFTDTTATNANRFYRIMSP